MIDVHLDIKTAVEDFKKKRRQFPKAVNAAINDVSSQAKTFISREIRNVYNIKASDLSKNFKLKRSTWSTLQARIDGYGRGISISRFGAVSPATPVLFSRQAAGRGTIKTGYSRYVVKARIKKSGPAKIIPGAFGMRGKLKTVLTRTGETRFPLKKVFGPGVATMFNDNMKLRADEFIRKKFPPILDNKIKFMES